MSLPIYKMYMYMTTCMYLNFYEAKALYMSVSEFGEVKLWCRICFESHVESLNGTLISRLVRNEPVRDLNELNPMYVLFTVYVKMETTKFPHRNFAPSIVTVRARVVLFRMSHYMVSKPYTTVKSPEGGGGGGGEAPEAK